MRKMHVYIRIFVFINVLMFYSGLKVNRNIYTDAVTCDRMRLIGPKCVFHTLMSVERKMPLVCEKKVAAFRAVVKYCSTNRLFMYACLCVYIYAFMCKS